MSVWYKDENYRRMILMDRYEKPLHLVKESEFHKLKNNYIMLQANSTTCTDNFDVYLQIVDQKVVDAKFVGEGCVISLTSTDFLLEALINKPINEILILLKKYLELVCNGKQTITNFPETLLLFNQIHKQSNRILCAANVAKLINEYMKGMK